MEQGHDAALTMAKAGETVTMVERRASILPSAASWHGHYQRYGDLCPQGGVPGRFHGAECWGYELSARKADAVMIEIS